jgi:hypothetical protein
MTVRLGDGVIALEGTCGADEAETLLALVEAHPGVSVDIARADQVHTALWQVLMAFGTDVVGTPDDPFVARWILPHLGTRDPSLPRPQSAPTDE